MGKLVKCKKQRYYRDLELMFLYFESIIDQFVLSIIDQFVWNNVIIC